MKRLISFMGAALLLVSSHAQKVSDRIESLLSSMSIEEKVGQMTQLTIDLVLKGQVYNPDNPATIDEEKLEKAILTYGVGSLLNTPSGLYITPEEWQGLIDAIQDKAAEARHQIPVLFGLDHVHGVSYIRNGTLFPQPLAMASTWNTSLVEEMSVVTAYESRAAGVPWSFSPAMDIGRNPVWPRLWESFGEDVLLNTEMGKAMVVGFQGDDMSDPYRIGACLKHFTGYGMPLSGKDRTPAWIPDRFLREYFLPQYQASIDAGALTIMVNSGEINGIPTHADKRLLTDILRGEMGFEGLVVSDWQDIHYLYDRHHVATSLKDAVRLAIEAGLDMSMTPTTYDFADLLVELVKEGTITEERIDLSVRRILHVKEKLGLFESTHKPFRDFPQFGDAQNKGLNLQAAKESIILTKNEDNILPISASSRLLVTGPSANTMRTLLGGWSTTWQGDQVDTHLSQYNTIAEAIVDKFGKANVTVMEEMENAPMLMSSARETDYIIYCLGETSYTEDQGNINDLGLPATELQNIQQLANTGKPIILIVTEGRPRIITEIEAISTAVLVGFYPGTYGGDAIASILIGETNPSGRMPITYPRYVNSLTPYDHKGTEDRVVDRSGSTFEPLYPFGYGLSYTTYAYNDMSTDKTTYEKDDNIHLKLTVSNEGAMAGMETVSVFVRDVKASITPPVRRLRAFRKINLAPGTTEEISFDIPVRDLAFVGQDNEWVVEAGQFIIMVGDLSTVIEVAD